jgi:hypothetical protein
MITAEYTFSCDFPRCPELWAKTVSNSTWESVNLAVIAARDAGWHISKGGCFCPDHADHIVKQLIKTSEGK